ncbi:MAG: nuclear transport factor 2 family protein [Phycisphaera sp.]|nr:MAG: nuclear transport factor 2 family protein [Phycisphaera sp.]
MSSIIDHTNTMMEQLQQGDFLSGMEQFYADDAVNEEVTGAKVVGREAIIENEKNVLEGVKAFHSVTVHSVGGHETSPGNGVTFAEYSIRVDMKDGSTFNPDQVQVTTWKDGKASHIKFYYDPSQM